MKQSPSSEANRFPPRVPILSQVNPVHTPTSHFLKFYHNTMFPSTSGSLKWLLSPKFPHQTLCTPLLSPISATCPAHLILLDFITRTVLGEEYRSSGYLLYSFLHSKLFSSARYSQTLSAYIPPSLWATKFHTHANQQAKGHYFHNVER